MSQVGPCEETMDYLTSTTSLTLAQWKKLFEAAVCAAEHWVHWLDKKKSVPLALGIHFLARGGLVTVVTFKGRLQTKWYSRDVSLIQFYGHVVSWVKFSTSQPWTVVIMLHKSQHTQFGIRHRHDGKAATLLLVVAEDALKSTTEMVTCSSPATA